MTNEFAIAVHALVFLNHKGTCQSSERIAENICVNPARARKILAMLKKAALIETKEGIDGGCFFTGNPAAITLEQVCKAVMDAPITITKKTGSIDMNCQISSGMGEIMDGVYLKMNEGCYERLRQITIDDIDKLIFK